MNIKKLFSYIALLTSMKTIFLASDLEKQDKRYPKRPRVRTSTQETFLETEIRRARQEAKGNLTASAKTKTLIAAAKALVCMRKDPCENL